MRWLAAILASLVLALALSSPSHSQIPQNCPPLSDAARAQLRDEHVYGGLPSPDAEPLIRRAYVTEYDADLRVPVWTAWKAVPDYVTRPQRVGRWATYRRDDEAPHPPVVTNDYLDVQKIHGLDRGHLIPYAVSGGDRDGDGEYAVMSGTLDIFDLDDACTVFEVNLMTNMAPQDSHFNEDDTSGLWKMLENTLRVNVLGDGHEDGATIYVIAGTVFSDRENPTWVTGRIREDGTEPPAIAVPDKFFQIVIPSDQESFPGVVPFLFVHTVAIHGERIVDGPGCHLPEEAHQPGLVDCIVTIAEIEEATGLDFFAELPDDVEAWLEESIGQDVWRSLLGE